MAYDEDLDDDLDDDDDFESGDPDEDELDCVPCPHCQVMIAEESERCPACGEYITFASGGLTRKGLWWWVAWTLLAILATFWLFRL